MGVVSICRPTAGNGAVFTQIEKRAATLFGDVGMDDIASAPPTPPHLYETCIAAERAWIAKLEGAVAGFLTWTMQDGHQFITELHVDPRYQGARLSAQLIGRLVRPSLSCFTEVPWNRPYYQRLGFRTVHPAALGAQHCAMAAEEHKRFAPWPRCIMVR